MFTYLQKTFHYGNVQRDKQFENSIRRAKALENILTKMDIYILDWERIVGNHAAVPEGLYYGIDMNWRSVKRIVSGKE